ncbi:MAG: aspartyl-tRNA amidotransferase subunit B [Planctomycetota bacterium]|nr:MAG: aspartyl-tRNA amidotransferase subunit B [Planctomycetota bacterium]
MTSLEARLRDDIKSAMKSGEKDALEVLRMLLADAKNVAIKEGGERTGLSDELVMNVLRKGVKTRAEAAKMYADAGRDDLESKERFQIEVLKQYLPAEMSEAELEVIVDTVIVELGASTKKEMGLVMKTVMERTEGRADGKRVSAIVGARLG